MSLARLFFRGAPFFGPLRNFEHLINASFAVIKHGYPASGLIVIGVTGTDGKTTTAHLIYDILKKAGFRVGLVSTVGAYVGDQEIDTGFHVTTPDPDKLQAFLVNFKKRGVTHVVLEATSHGLDQHRVLGCNFKVGVLTNITHEHLDYHKTFERYRVAKAKLFRGVDVAVINRDDPSFNFIKGNTKRRAKIISYGLRNKASLTARKIRFQPAGLRFEVADGKKRVNVQIKLNGNYNVSNCLAAAGVGRGLGIGWDQITEAMKMFHGVQGRMEIIDEGQNFSVIVDFAHTPGAYEELFKTLDKLKPKISKLIAVFGAPGERDRDKRPMMGRVATRFCDFMVLTTDDPRHEDPERIIDEITRGIRQDAQVWDGKPDWRIKGKWVIRILDRGEAIAFAIQRLAKKGDIVVLLGQGHQKAMPIGDREVLWSDQEAARIALRGGIKKLWMSQN